MLQVGHQSGKSENYGSPYTTDPSFTPYSRPKTPEEIARNVYQQSNSLAYGFGNFFHQMFREKRILTETST